MTPGNGKSAAHSAVALDLSACTLGRTGERVAAAQSHSPVVRRVPRRLQDTPRLQALDACQWLPGLAFR